MMKIKSRSMMKAAGIFAPLLILPIWAVSWELFRTAAVRNNKTLFFESRWVKFFISRKEKKRTGSTAEEEAEEKATAEEMVQRVEQGKKWFLAQQGKKWFLAQQKERIVITSYDGLKLAAYYLPAERDHNCNDKNICNKVMLLMHGYRNDGFTDFAGLVEFYHKMGYHLLVPHQRSHGESEGEYICYGVKERYDVRQWTEYMVSRFEGNCSIFLSGISMGGASVLMAAGLELPKQVKGIIADCAFTSPRNIFVHVLRQEGHLPSFPFLYIVNAICRARAGYGLGDCSATACMKKNKIPVLFIHGGKDTFVPTQMSYENYEACSAEKEILIVDQATHGVSNLVEPEKYRTTVMEFMEKYENGN